MTTDYEDWCDRTDGREDPEPPDSAEECDVCGASFASPALYDAHVCICDPHSDKERP